MATAPRCTEECLWLDVVRTATSLDVVRTAKSRLFNVVLPTASPSASSPVTLPPPPPTSPSSPSASSPVTHQRESTLPPPSLPLVDTSAGIASPPLSLP